MLRRLFLAFLAANCLFAQSAPVPAPLSATSPQAPPAKSTQSDAQSKISVDSDLVVLPVTVKDQHGDLVPDLNQSDFRVFDEGIEQSIDVFTEEAFPLSLVVLIDDDLKSKDAAQMAPTLRAITGGISANDEALVARFDIDFYPGDQFTSDLDKLWADLKTAQVRVGPTKTSPPPYVSGPLDACNCPLAKAPTNLGARASKALDDAIHSAAELLHDRGLARRKIILVVSDGVNGPQFNRFTYQDSLQALLLDNISVYSRAVGNSLTKGKFQRLANYSNDSGGDIYYAGNSAKIEKLYAQITEEARHEYTLAYVPRAIHSADPYHKVEVRVNRPSVTVKTRQGYYIAPPSPPEAPSSGHTR